MSLTHNRKLRLVLAVAVESDSGKLLPFGPRYRRGDPLPYEDEADDKGGYYFEPDDLDEAKKILGKLQRYIDSHQKPPKAVTKKEVAKYEL